MKIAKDSSYFASIKQKTKGNPLAVVRHHGGSKSLGRRKSRRPLSKTNKIYLVMSSSKAIGRLAMKSMHLKVQIDHILHSQAVKFGVRLDRTANTGNQLHLTLRIRDRQGFQNFLRSSSALIARLVTRARKGRPFGKFWDHLALTQILKTPYELKRAWRLVLAVVNQSAQDLGAQYKMQRLWESSA